MSCDACNTSDCYIFPSLLQTTCAWVSQVLPLAAVYDEITVLNKVIPLRSDTISSNQSQRGAENLERWSGELFSNPSGLSLCKSSFK